MRHELEKELKPIIHRYFNRRTGEMHWTVSAAVIGGFSHKRTPEWAMRAAAYHALKLNNLEKKNVIG